MKTFWKVLFGVFALLAALVTGAVLYVSNMDPVRLNDLAAKAVRDAYGRELTTAGGMHVELFPVVRLEASQVSLSNAAWAAEKDMVRIGHVRAELALLPLLIGSIQVHRMVFLEPQVFLETDAEGRGNWVSGDAGATPAQGVGTGAAPTGINLGVKELHVEQASLRYHDGATGRTTNVSIEELDATRESVAGGMTVRLRGAYQGMAVAVDGTVGALGKLLDDKGISVDVSATVGDATLEAAGMIDKPLGARGLNLTIAVDAPATKPFTDLAGIDFENLGPVALKARLLERDGSYRLEDVDLNARGLGVDLVAEGSVAALVTDPAPDLRVSATAQSTERLTGLAGLDLPPMGPISLSARLRGEAGHYHLEDMELTGQGLGADFSASGTVTDLDATPSPDLAVQLSAASTTRLAELAELDIPDLGPLEFQGRLVEKTGSLDLEAIELTAHPAEVDLRVQGTVAGLRGQPRPDVVVHAKTDRLHRLLATLPAVGPVDISAKIVPRGEIIDIGELAARVGKSDLSGRLQVKIGGKRPEVTGKLHAGVLDFDELVPAASKSETKEAQTGAGGERVFPDDPLPLAWLSAADADVQLTAARIVAHELVLEDVDLSLALHDLRLDVKPTFGVAGGRVQGEVGVDGAKSPAAVSVRLDGKAIDIGQLSAAFREAVLVKEAPMDFRIDVEGSGDSVRAIMAGLDGTVLLDAGKGELLGDRINRAGGDVFSQLLVGVIPRGDEERNVMQCGVVHFEILDGFAVADQSLVVETNKVLLKGGGAVDLASEQLDLGARMAARSGLRIGAGSLASAMKIEGTIAAPRLGLDLKGAAAMGARVTAGVMTMGLSLVAENVYGQLTGDPHPCETARAREFEPRRRGEDGSLITLPDGKKVTQGVRDATKATGQAIEGTAKKTGELLESIGSGIKKIFE